MLELALAGVAMSAYGAFSGAKAAKTAAKNAEAEAAYNRQVEAYNAEVNSNISRYNVEVTKRQEQMYRDQYAFDTQAAELERKQVIGQMFQDKRAVRGQMALNSNLSDDVVRSVVTDQMAAISITNTSYKMQEELDRFNFDSNIFALQVDRQQAEYGAQVGREVSLTKQGQITMSGQNSAANYRAQGYATLMQGAGSALTQAASMYRTFNNSTTTTTTTT